MRLYIHVRPMDADELGLFDDDAKVDAGKSVALFNELFFEAIEDRFPGDDVEIIREPSSGDDVAELVAHGLVFRGDHVLGVVRAIGERLFKQADRWLVKKEAVS